MSASYLELKSLVASIDYEMKKFEARKVKVSGARVRASLLSVKKLADKMRKDIQEQIRELPSKSRPIKIPKKTSLKKQASQDVPVSSDEDTPNE